MDQKSSSEQVNKNRSVAQHLADQSSEISGSYAQPPKSTTPYASGMAQLKADELALQRMDDMDYEEEDDYAGQMKKASGFTVQRMEEEEEDYAQMKRASSAPVQRMSDGDYKEDEMDYPMQGKFNANSFTVQKMDADGAGPVPGDLQAKMESTMGADFSDVNVHTESSAATDVGALAFAQGKDVHFAPGQFKPETTSGQELIGHEFAHVQQQSQGRVQATTEVAGMPVNDNIGLEAEADALGKAAAQAKLDPNQTKK